MTLSLIVAVAENGTIGRDGAMPWRLSADLRRFRELTMGHCIIMGRKTYESIGRALPGRRTIVLTRTPNFTAADVQTAAGWDRAMQLADGDEQPFVIGEAPRFLQRRFPARAHVSNCGACAAGGRYVFSCLEPRRVANRRGTAISGGREKLGRHDVSHFGTPTPTWT